MGDLKKLKIDFERSKLDELASFLKKKEEISFDNSSQSLVSVILVLYNRAELTLQCLKSLKKHCHIPIELIVIDNNSTDDTSKLFAKVKGVNYIKNKENKNFLLACNQAADIAKGKYLLFLNNDATIRESAIENAVKVFSEESNVGAVGAKIVLLDGKLQEAGSIVWNDGSCLGYGRGKKPDLCEFMHRREVNFCSGAFLLTPSSLFHEIGKFDESFAPAYYEETDYCLSIQEHGYKVIYEPTCIIDHFEFASSAKQSSAIKLQRKNQKIFFEKHKEYISHLHEPKEENIILARQINNKKRILFIEDRIPHEDLGAGFPRSNQIVNSMINLGYDVTIYSLNFLQEDNWTNIFRDLDKKIELITTYARANFDKFKENRIEYYDLIWISRPHNMEFMFDKLSDFKNIKVIYDAEAIFSDRAIEKVKLTGEDLDIEKILKTELSLSDYADAVVAVKEKDAQLFKEHGKEKTHILNVAFPPPKYLAPFDVRNDILFVGNMDYDESPNVDSLAWFIDKVLPKIKETIPEVKLHLVGTNKSSKIRSYGESHDNITLHGKVNDLTQIYNSCKLFIAPTRYAAGSPAKVFMAAAYGIPIIASELIISQVGWNKGEHLEGCHPDDDQLFAALCCKVYEDKILWSKLSSNSLNKILKQNGVDAYLQQLDEIITSTLGIGQIKRKKVKRLNLDNIENKEVKKIYESLLMLRKENMDLKHQIKEGESYVIKLLEEINNKNTEINLRGEVITYHEQKFLFKVSSSIKHFFKKLGEPFIPLTNRIGNFLKLLWIFIKSPLNSIKHLNFNNAKEFFEAIKNEPISNVLNNIAKKINPKKHE